MQSLLTRPFSSRARDEQGIALIVSLMAMTLMMALGMALMLTTMTEGKIAGNYRDGTEASYAADAAVERVMQDILTVPDWNQMLNGQLTSAFIDGPPNGVRELPDGTSLNLTEATNVIMAAITELLATLRGGQPPLVRWDPLAHNQSTHGRFIEQGGKTGGSATPEEKLGDSDE